MTIEDRSTGGFGDRWGHRLGAIALELAVIGVVYYFFIADVLLLGGIAGVVVLAGVVPERYSSVVSGVGLLGLAAAIYLVRQWTQIPIVLGLIGLVMLVGGVMAVRKSGRARN